MRILIAIVLGVLVGALLFEGPGAGLGFLVGLVGGLIWYGRGREAKQAQAGQAAPAAAQRPPSELELLKARLAAIEERLVRLEGGEVAVALQRHDAGVDPGAASVAAVTAPTASAAAQAAAVGW